MKICRVAMVVFASLFLFSTAQATKECKADSYCCSCDASKNECVPNGKKCDWKGMDSNCNLHGFTCKSQCNSCAPVY